MKRLFSALLVCAAAFAQNTAESIAMATHLYGLYVSALDYGVVCDGSTDNSTALQNAINAAYNGTLIIHGPLGQNCNFSTTLNITSPIKFELLNANLIKTGTSAALNITAPSGVRIEGNGQTLTGVTCAGCTSDAIVVGTLGSSYRDYSLTDFYVVVGPSARDNIHFNAGFYNLRIAGVRTDGNPISYTTGAGINYAPKGVAGDYILIDFNVVRWTNLGIVIAGRNFTSSRIVHNQMASIAGSGVSMTQAGQSLVEANTFIYCNKVNTGAALSITPTTGYVTDLWVKANSFQANGTASFPSTSNIDILVSGAHALNIHLKDNQFNDQTVTRGAGRAIVMRNVNGATVEGSDIDQTGWVGAGGVDIDASNTNVYYWSSYVVPGTTEYWNAAGITNPWPNIYSPGIVSAVTLESTGGGRTIEFTGNIADISTNSDAGAVGVNYTGYQFGTARFRNFNVFDGKNSSLVSVNGSSETVGIGPGLGTPLATLHVEDNRKTTGSTTLRIQAGQGQGTNPVLISKSNDGTVTGAGIDAGLNIALRVFTFGTLPSSANGAVIFCSDCNATCTAGSSTGRTCFRENGVWTH